MAGICREIALITQVDSLVKATERKVNCGQATQTMVLNALGFMGHPPDLTLEFFAKKPVDLFIGPGYCTADFIDNTLARCLNGLYAAGVTAVFRRVAKHALQGHGIGTRFAHLVSSSFHLHGVNDQQ